MAEFDYSRITKAKTDIMDDIHTCNDKFNDLSDSLDDHIKNTNREFKNVNKDISRLRKHVIKIKDGLLNRINQNESDITEIQRTNDVINAKINAVCNLYDKLLLCLFIFICGVLIVADAAMIAYGIPIWIPCVIGFFVGILLGYMRKLRKIIYEMINHFNELLLKGDE